MAIPTPGIGRIQPILLISGAIVLTIVLAATMAARFVARFNPRVGDIVSFDPSAPTAFASEARFAVLRPERGGCELDMGLIRQMGGSFVVERQGPPPTRIYLVHWAGRHTSAGAKDCGVAADLLLPVAELVAVATAAGGFGAAR